MFGCDCLGEISEYFEVDPLPDPFSLPAPLPHWPQGEGFASGTICLGELEVAKMTSFESVWSCKPTRGKSKGVTFYKPVGIPDGFFCLGYYCQSNDQPLRGYVLVAKEMAEADPNSNSLDCPALEKPVNYTLVWTASLQNNTAGFIWSPNPPVGYRAMGFVVTDTDVEPSVDDIRCVRADLTEDIESCDLLLNGNSIYVWDTRPCRRGMFGTGVPVGTFFCCTDKILEQDVLTTACLKNRDSSLHAMPNLDQIHAIINHYGPTVYFHPDETFLPSSVEWFFENGALIYQNGKPDGERIDSNGSLLPQGGINDGEFWIDLPKDDTKRNRVKCGNLESAELYVHVKPALGGSFTDIVMWVFCPFNGPMTLKIGSKSLPLSRLGEHVSDWEHFTLRVSNFNGKLKSIYFSQHSGGEWVEASDLEYMDGSNKTVVYSSKSGHSSFAHPGTYIQGSSKLGIGIRNDAAKSRFFVDSSTKYRVIAAEYLGDGGFQEPCWLQYMREWGPTIVYDARSEVEKIINHLPVFFRFSVETLLDLFPTELYGEEGPTGPKEKDNWYGDERC